MRAITPISIAALILALGCSGSDSPTGPTAPAKHSPTATSPSPSPTPAGTKHGRIYFATASAGGMSISTDKDDYAPGDTVHFTGAGWTANDTLNAVLSEATTGVRLTWTIPVAADGTFRDSSYVVSEADLGASFTLTVTSKSDPQQTLTVTFTDANVNVKAQPDGVQFSLGVTNYTAANCTGTATVQSPVTIGSSNTGFPIGGAPGNPVSIMFTAAATSTLGAAFGAWSGGGTVQADTKMVCVSSAISIVATYTAAPDLILAKSHTGSFTAGGTGQYKITVSNTGTASAKGAAPSQKITVTDNLPTGLTYASAQSPNANSATSGKWTCGAVGQDVTCSYAPGQDILPSASADDLYLTVNVAANAASSVTNHASVSSGSVAESNTNNNTVDDVTSITGVGPTKLAFTTAPFTVVVGQCSPKVTVQTQTAGGTPSNPSTAVTVNLTSTSTGGAFYSDVGCTTAITSVGIATSANSADFYYKDSKAGAPKLTAADAAAVLTSADQTETVNKAATSVTLTDDPAGSSVFGQSVTFTATVSATAPGSGTPDGDVKFYEFAAGGTCAAPNGTLLDTKTLNGSGQAQFSTATLAASTTAHTISACYQASSNYVASGNSVAHTVNKAQVTSAASVSPSTQQYSDKVTLSTSISVQTPGALAGETLTGSVEFFIGATSVGSVSNLSITAVPATVTLTPDYALIQAAGAYTVTATFTSTNTNFNSTSSATGETGAALTVTKEDATVDFPSGNPLGALVNTSFTLQATIWETNPELNPAGQGVAAGDISNAVVGTSNFQLQNILGGGAIPASSCATTDNGFTGYSKKLTVTCTFNAATVSVGTYAVQVTVSGNYYTGYGEDVFTVFDPSLGFVTGGGRYMLGGDRVNFGFTVKYNKKGTQPQGSLLVVRHHADGTETRAKSNVLSGLAVNNDKSATFSGKANYYDQAATWLGNLAFTAYVKDVAEPGINQDLFGLYVAVTDANGVATSSMLTGLVGSAQVIVGGNIQVPQPSGGK